MKLIKIHPFSRINDGWLLRDHKILDLLSRFDNNTTFVNFQDDYDPQRAEPALYQSAFLHVITETVYHYPHNAYGEKTFKPISCFRPFVVLNVPGALRDLHDLGYKTFSDWWDESYDLIQDPTQRLLAVIDIVEWVCQLDIGRVKAMLEEMTPILQHNYHHYCHVMVPQEMEKFDLACRLNLKSR